MIFNNIFLSELFFPFLLYFLIDVFHFVFYKNTFQSSDFLKRPYFFEATRRFLWKFYFIYFFERNFCSKHTHSPSFINKRWKCAISSISFKASARFYSSAGLSYNRIDGSYRDDTLFVVKEKKKPFVLSTACDSKCIFVTLKYLWQFSQHKGKRELFCPREKIRHQNGNNVEHIFNSLTRTWSLTRIWICLAILVSVLKIIFHLKYLFKSIGLMLLKIY